MIVEEVSERSVSDVVKERGDAQRLFDAFRGGNGTPRRLARRVVEFLHDGGRGTHEAFPRRIPNAAR